MDVIFDTATGQMEIDASGVQPTGANIRARVNRHGLVVNLRGVEMRLTITADGAEIFDLSLPPAGVRYRQTDQDMLATGRVSWKPDQQIEVSAWCKTNSGHKVTAQAQLTAPRPEQPYPSWTWSGIAWEAPLPYPNDGGDYVWDESSGEWLTAPDDEALI